MLTRTRDAIVIFLTGIVLFTFGLYSQEIIGFEARFYLFAQEMWRHGVTWFPTTYQQPYPDYPVTSTFLIYILSKLFGGLNKLTAVLPSAIASAMTLSVTYLIGALQNRAWGWSAAIFLLFTLTFVVEARTISLDQYITLITALSFYIASRGKNTGFIFALFILGFFIRGPIGVVIPAGVLCIFYALEKKGKLFFVTGFGALLVLIICTLILLGLAYHVGGQAFVQDVLRMEVDSRIQDPSRLPVSFYFTESLGAYAVTYLLACLVLVGYLPQLFKKNATAEVKWIRKLLGWALVVIIGLSIPSDKKIRYILPFTPALALICAGLFYGFTRNYYLRMLKTGFRFICLFFPSIALLVVLYGYVKRVDLGLNYPVLFIVFILLQGSLIFLRKRTLFVLGLAALTFYVGIVGVMEVINLHINKTRDFVLSVETLREKQYSPLVFFQEGPDGMPIKYLVNMSRDVMPIYLQQVGELVKLPRNTMVIVDVENYPHIPANVSERFHIIMRGKIGHDDVVVLRKS